MWFGTTADEQLVDPGFPRRFVPRAFDAILRNEAHLILPSFTSELWYVDGLSPVVETSLLGDIWKISGTY